MIIEHRYVRAHDMESMKAYFFDADDVLYMRIIWLNFSVVVFAGEEMSMGESVACINDQIKQKWPLEITDFVDVPLLRSRNGEVLYPKNPNDFWKRLKNAVKDQDDRV
jgi:hypothetical protein